MVVHPQSVVHSMVQFIDGSVKAQLGVPDMHLPIAIALAFPDRLPDVTTPPDLVEIGHLGFEPVDDIRYPALPLARMAGEMGGTAPAVLNAANEDAVARFLSGQLRFVDIIPAVQSCVDAAPRVTEVSLQAILEADRWARAHVARWQPSAPARPSKRPA